MRRRFTERARGSVAQSLVRPPHDVRSAYGRLKLRAEYAALASHANAIVLRVPVLYGPCTDVAESAVTTFARNVIAAEACVLDDWQVRVPTYTPDIALTLVNVVAAAVAGESALRSGTILHYSSPEKFTRYTLALLIGQLLGLPTSHISGNPAAPSGAPRPHDATLATARLTSLGLAAPSTPLVDGLRHVFGAFTVDAAARTILPKS